MRDLSKSIIHKKIRENEEGNKEENSFFNENEKHELNSINIESSMSEDNMMENKITNGGNHSLDSDSKKESLDSLSEKE